MKYLLLIVILFVVSGCLEPIDQQLIPTPNKWIETYGDSRESRIIYNIAAMRAALNQHAKVLDQQAKMLSRHDAFIRQYLNITTQPIENKALP